MTSRSGSGAVIAYDDQRGLGLVEAHEGPRFPFHCTAIADGSRSITVGTGVTFDVVPGVGGTWEAANVRALVT